MSKADTLLKKAAFYEKMALYSDRKTFLQALAQTKTLPLSADIKQGIEGAVMDLSSTAPNSQPLQSLLMSFYEGRKTDLNQLADALVQASNAIPGNNTTQVQRILNTVQKVRELSASQNAPSQDPGQGEAPIMFGKPTTDVIRALPPIPRDVQEMLSGIVTAERIGVPLAPIKGKSPFDGKIGKDTRTAMNAFKKHFMQGQGSDQQVIQKVKEVYEADQRRDKKYPELSNAPAPIDWDQVAKQKREYDESTGRPPGTVGAR